MKKGPSSFKGNIAADLPTTYYWEQVRHFGKRYPKFHWPSVETLLNLVYTYNIIETHFAQRIGKYGLSLSAFNVLMILSRSAGHACKQRDLTKLLIVSRANITGLVDSLVRQGLVSRMEDPDDRRVCIAKITKAGEDLLEQLLPAHYEEIARLLSGLKPKEKTALSGLLTRMRKNFFESTAKVRP